MMLPSREDYEPLCCMQVHVQSLLTGPLSGNAVLETSPNSTVESLVASFCALKNVNCSSDLVIFDCNNRSLVPSATLDAEKIEDGATVLLGSKRNDGNAPGISWRLLGFLALAIGGGGLIAVALLYSVTGGEVPFDYAVVIDAGSTHSQALLYRWSGDKWYGTGEVFQEGSCYVNGGITVTDDIDAVLRCVDKLVHFIPSTSKAHSYLYFGATAGMRLLNLTSTHTAKLIILNLQCALPKAGIAVQSVKIITGQVEGVSAWITANLLTNSLYPKKQENPQSNNMYGALDMGGASTQYAFATDPSKLTNKSDAMNLRLYGYNYSVVSKSYLCYGLTEAFRRHFALLVKDLNSTETINDPCLPKGNTTVLTAEYLFDQPCTITTKFELWMISNPANKQKKFFFQGGSDYQKCSSLVTSQLNNSACKAVGFKECAEPNPISLSAEKFMAISSFFYITSFLNSTNSSLDEFLFQTERWCAKTWSEIDEFHFQIFPQLLLRYCFSGFYIAEWLTGMYNFSQNTWSNLVFVEKIGNAEVGWALGYMVNATNAIPEDSPSLPVLSTITFSILTILCCLLVIISIVLLFQYRKNKYQGLDEVHRSFIET